VFRGFTVSIQAMSNVIGRHEHGYQDGSSNKGAVFLVELMIADSVNDQNGNVFWMSNENLAKKARVSRETANRCVSRLEAAGVLRRKGSHDSGAVRWQWIGHPEGVTRDHTCDERSHLGVTTDHKGCDDTSHEPKESQTEPKPTVVDFDANLDQIRTIKAGQR
jgi:hypothetical protein